MNKLASGVCVGVLMLLTVGCGGSSTQPSIDETPSAGAAPSAGAVRYASRQFALPLEVDVPAWLPAEPAADEPNFLTWTGDGASVERAVRFLLPVNLYPPGSTTTAPVPGDYLTYLRTQAGHGARFADERSMTIGGHSATVLTATTTTNLDGSLGCPAERVAAADCFGLQEPLALRVAVIDAGDTTLLIWARALNGGSDVAGEFAEFERMLSTVSFR